MKCDFCGGSVMLPARVFRPGEAIVVHFPNLTLVDGPPGWTACRECDDLIDGRRWHDLMIRTQNVSPSFRIAREAGKIDELSHFVAQIWAKIFQQPARVFLEKNGGRAA